MAYNPNLPSPFFPNGYNMGSRRNSPPSDPSTPGLMVSSPMWGGGSTEWSTQARNGVMVASPLGHGFPPGVNRRPLGDVPSNQTPALGLASPFVPSDPAGLWGPPLGTMTPEQRSMSLEKELAALQRQIRELSIENQQLKQREVIRYRSPSTPSLHNFSPMSFHTPGPIIGQTSPSAYFDSIGSSIPYSSYGGTPMDNGIGNGNGIIGNENGNGNGNGEGKYVRNGSPSSVDENGCYCAPRLLQSDLLRGVYNFNDMRDVEIRPIVWVIAHMQPHNSMESASLKAAVSNLANRFTMGNQHPTCILLVNAIFEWAKPLCFTSCGNYLCQQLLEKADMPDKQKFIDTIKEEIVDIAGDKFGTHVLCKAVAIKELEEPIAEALLKFGVFDSLKTGARRLWREYLEKCRQSRSQDIFHKINEEMTGRWADLACANEHGSIAVQQVFEVFGSMELTDPCFNEAISSVANSQFGHFLITKLLGYPHLVKPTCEAIISSYPPVAITHHGVNFVKIALSETARSGLSKYIESICCSSDEQTPGIVSIATASVGKAHLIFVLGYLNPHEQARVRGVCKQYSTTLRNSQSGNDLLRSLGIIHAVGARFRSGSTA